MSEERAMKAVELPIVKIHTFRDHPFKVVDDLKMKELVDSIRENGILVPVIVRPDGEDSYEMVSGHRRMHAATLIGLTTVPAIIREMNHDEAIIVMVDANLQREGLLPSERAFAFRMRLDAIKHQGERNDLKSKEQNLTSGTEFHEKSRDQIGEEVGISGRQVQKYIRLTSLIPELLEKVDQKHLPMVLAVRISYFSGEVQHWLYLYMEEHRTPVRKSQIDELERANLENLTQHTLNLIMESAVSKQADDGKIILTKRKLDHFFAKTVPTTQRESVILDLLTKWRDEQSIG